MQKNKIELAVVYKKQLAKEFNKTYQAVSMSLAYVFNSENAKAIRRRAKELLENEAKNVEI